MEEKKDLGKTSMGMEPNLAATLSYVAGIITGLIFYVLEKENKFVRFHAMQSILFCAAWFVIIGISLLIPVLGVILMMFINIAGIILWVVLMLKAYSGEQFKLPVIGDIAEKNA